MSNTNIGANLKLMGELERLDAKILALVKVPL